MKPYLAYYDNLKKLPDYSLGNPICFLCKEETILFSVWEVGTFHLSKGGRNLFPIMNHVLFIGLFVKNKSLQFTWRKKKLLSLPSYIHP